MSNKIVRLFLCLVVLFYMLPTRALRIDQQDWDGTDNFSMGPAPSLKETFTYIGAGVGLLLLAALSAYLSDKFVKNDKWQCFLSIITMVLGGGALLCIVPYLATKWFLYFAIIVIVLVLLIALIYDLVQKYKRK